MDTLLSYWGKSVWYSGYYSGNTRLRGGLDRNEKVDKQQAAEKEIVIEP